MRRWIHLAGSGRLAAALGLVLAASAGSAEGQSLFANRGLGLVLDPQDGRSAGVGGVRIGLPDSGLSWTNPAAAAGLPAPGFLGSLQYDQFTADFQDRASDGSTARFPLVLASFPFGRWAVTVGYGGYVDQNWSIEQVDTLRLEQDTVPVVDQLQSEGGVSRLRGGVAYLVREGLSVGAALDVYTGATSLTNGRIFPNEGSPSCCSRTWHSGGVGFTLGARWSPSEAFSLGVALQEGGTLESTAQATAGEAAVEAQEEQEGEENDELERELASLGVRYDLPMALRVGASGRVAANFLVALSAERTGWSSLDERFSELGGARDTWSLHGGVEFDGLSIRDRPVPLRLGARRTDLPFAWEATPEEAEFAHEQALTGGIGVVMAGGATRTDLGFERGTRGGDAAGIEESYWRLVLSVQVLGL